MIALRQSAQRLLNAPSVAPHIRSLSYWHTLHPQFPVCSSRSLAFSACRAKDTSPGGEKASNPGSAPPSMPKSEKVAFELEPRLSLTFTCTAAACGTRSSHQFTRRSYEKGIVIVECPECKNRHLIADHLGWFKESTEDGKLKTVEDLMRAKGEKVRRGVLNAGGVVEYAPE